MSDLPHGATPVRSAAGAPNNSGQCLQEALDALDAMALQFGWRGAEAASLRRSYQQSIQAAAA